MTAHIGREVIDYDHRNLPKKSAIFSGDQTEPMVLTGYVYNAIGQLVGVHKVHHENSGVVPLQSTTGFAYHNGQQAVSFEMAVKVVKAGGQTTIDGQDIGKIRSVNLIDTRGKVLATDRSYVGQVAAAEEELQTTWRFHHLDGSLFTESETWKPQDFSFGGWQPAVMDSDYAATTRDKSLHQWNGVGRENQFWSTFRSDYAHYLTNPSEMKGRSGTVHVLRVEGSVCCGRLGETSRELRSCSHLSGLE